MKTCFFSLVFIFCLAFNAFAFNPNPMDYEFIGQMKNGNGIFYQKSATKEGEQKTEFVRVKADPNNRTLSYYTMLLDIDSMTMRAIDCKVYDYKGNLLNSFVFLNANTSYKKDDLNDGTYKSGSAKVIEYEPIDKIEIDIVSKL